MLPPVVAELQPLATTTPAAPPSIHDAWDAALSQTQLEDLLAVDPGPVATDPQAIASGLNQLDRYLSRTWSRAGISPQAADDCTQGVYATLLQNWGRSSFDAMLAEVGTTGIRATLSRDTPDGPDFFRAIDTVKKRAQRERSYTSLDDGLNVAATGSESPWSSWRGALQEAIDRNLSPREAALIQATLQGETPAEIAQQWGVAPKTVSNEKTRAIQKLREALVSDLAD